MGNAKKHDRMEENYDNFIELYDQFRANITILEDRIFENHENAVERIRLQGLFDELRNLDVKLRLAFGIQEIILNPLFVDEKQNDLKLCHLLYYKIADLWFAYETYIIFYTKLFQTTKNKIEWLDAATHSNYSNQLEISNSLNLIRHNLSQLYASNERRNSFLEYLNYCLGHSIHGQHRRLTNLIAKIQNENFNLSHSDILTIIYSVRNNFVHNGETTVVPEVFGYQNKVRLLEILYPYLSIITLKSSNSTFERI